MKILTLNNLITYLKSVSTTKYCIVFGLILYFIHFGFRSPSDNHTKPIKGDAEAYYAYLPALIIYNDPSYSFIQTEGIEKNYYFENSSKSFLNELKNGKQVNKTFPGVAILYLPFFLIAHLIAIVLGLASDGYSDIYQYFFDFGQFFYATLGMIFFCKVLSHFRFRKWKVLLALVIITLGTNLWYYILLDQSVTHIYNFFLINLAVYLFLKFITTKEHKLSQLLVVVFGLIIITRPTNIITLPFLLIFLPKEQFNKETLGIFLNSKLVLFTFTMGLIFIAIPILLWQWQADVWIAYSYGEEKFDFGNPQIFNFLFSYIKGWFVYTPLAFVILLIGIPLTLYHNKKQGFIILVFYAISIFIYSSWWCWFYGCTMSQRVMVDHYLLLGLLLVYIINFFEPKKTSFLLGVPVLFIILLNQIQSYQVFNGFFPCGETTKEMYWDHFMCLTPKAKVYEKRAWNKKEEFQISLPGVTNDTITYGDTQVSEQAHTGNQIFKTGNHREFVGGIYLPTRDYSIDERIVVSVWVHAKNIPTSTRMIVEVMGEPSTYKDYYFTRFSKSNEWVKMEFLYQVDKDISGHLYIYFWNPELNEEVWFDDIIIEKFTL